MKTTKQHPQSNPIISYITIVIGFFALVYVLWYLFADGGPFGKARKRDEGLRHATEESNRLLKEKQAVTRCLEDANNQMNDYIFSHPKASQAEIATKSKELKDVCDQKFPPSVPDTSK